MSKQYRLCIDFKTKEGMQEFVQELNGMGIADEGADSNPESRILAAFERDSLDRSTVLHRVEEYRLLRLSMKGDRQGAPIL